jgi:hypothetical protein
MTRGLTTSAGEATRCCCPPENIVGCVMRLPGDHGEGSFARFRRRALRLVHEQLHLLDRACGEEVELLEDEAEFAAAQERLLVIRHAADIVAFEVVVWRWGGSGSR